MSQAILCASHKKRWHLDWPLLGLRGANVRFLGHLCIGTLAIKAHPLDLLFHSSRETSGENVPFHPQHTCNPGPGDWQSASVEFTQLE